MHFVTPPCARRCAPHAAPHNVPLKALRAEVLSAMGRGTEARAACDRELKAAANEALADAVRRAGIQPPKRATAWS
eukprot:2276550-Prymnesium_polylepis.1